MMAPVRLHQLFRNMEVVGKLQECDKLSTVHQDFYIDKPGYTTGWARLCRGDRYDLNVQNIENNIDELIRGVRSTNDPVYTMRATEHLKNARRGLVNLERTYIDRVQAQAAILVLRQDLDVRISELVQYGNVLVGRHSTRPAETRDEVDAVVDAVVYRSDRRLR